MCDSIGRRNLISNVLISNILSYYVTRTLLGFFFFSSQERESELKAFPHQLKYSCVRFSGSKSGRSWEIICYFLTTIMFLAQAATVSTGSRQVPLCTLLKNYSHGPALCSGHIFLWLQALGLSCLCLGCIRLDSRTKE